MSIKFSDLEISSPLQKGLQDLEISEPTFIQKKTIPVVLHQKEDLVALAKLKHVNKVFNGFVIIVNEQSYLSYMSLH